MKRAVMQEMGRRAGKGGLRVLSEKNLEENLANLVKRMKNGSYRPNPTRRVYIPKEQKAK